jgi:hypothetical protein
MVASGMKFLKRPELDGAGARVRIQTPNLDWKRIQISPASERCATATGAIEQIT